MLLYFVLIKKTFGWNFSPAGSRLTSTVPVAKVRESPDVSQAHAIADAGKQKLILAAPLPSGKVDRCLMDGRGRARRKLGLWNRTAHTMRHREPIHLGLTLSRRENRNQSDLYWFSNLLVVHEAALDYLKMKKHRSGYQYTKTTLMLPLFHYWFRKWILCCNQYTVHFFLFLHWKAINVDHRHMLFNVKYHCFVL